VMLYHPSLALHQPTHRWQSKEKGWSRSSQRRWSYSGCLFLGVWVDGEGWVHRQGWSKSSFQSGRHFASGRSPVGPVSVSGTWKNYR
jgi:hypothetical protein